MTKLIELIDAGTAKERTPEEVHYFELVDLFIAAQEEIEGTHRVKPALRQQLASAYYALIACPEHANHPAMHYVYEVVAKSSGIDLTRPLSKEQQEAANDTYETEYLEASELGLTEAQNALRLPRLTTWQRRRLQDDVTFYGAELVCHERSFKSAARRRKCTKLIEEHDIDRAAPLQYHRP